MFSKIVPLASTIRYAHDKLTCWALATCSLVNPFEMQAFQCPLILSSLFSWLVVVHLRLLFLFMMDGLKMEELLWCSKEIYLYISAKAYLSQKVPPVETRRQDPDLGATLGRGKSDSRDENMKTHWSLFLFLLMLVHQFSISQITSDFNLIHHVDWLNLRYRRPQLRCSRTQTARCLFVQIMKSVKEKKNISRPIQFSRPHDLDGLPFADAWTLWGLITMTRYECSIVVSFGGGWLLWKSCFAEFIIKCI
jgi:hypothetical protein